VVNEDGIRNAEQYMNSRGRTLGTCLATYVGAHLEGDGVHFPG
jgi:hypothetical protein